MYLNTIFRQSRIRLSHIVSILGFLLIDSAGGASLVSSKLTIPVSEVHHHGVWVDQYQINLLQVGWSKDKVKNMLGQPLLHPLHPDRFDYYYVYKFDNTEDFRKVLIFFKEEKIDKIESKNVNKKFQPLF